MLVAAFVSGCMSVPSAPQLGLQRSLFPGLTDLPPDAIASAFETRLQIRPPVSAGLAWLSERSTDWSVATLSEYQRTGVLDAGLAELSNPPFSSVTSMPTEIAEWTARAPTGLGSLRSAAAQFQYDVALVLQTGVADSGGLNPFAIGYLGLVTAPLFPGADIGVSAGAEICGVDVRSGIMLACARGRAVREARFVFPLSARKKRVELHEDAVKEATVSAARELRDRMAERLARNGDAARRTQ